jgi:hypothetical protein
MRLCDDCDLLVDVAGKLLDLSFGVHRTSPICGSSSLAVAVSRSDWGARELRTLRRLQPALVI